MIKTDLLNKELHDTFDKSNNVISSTILTRQNIISNSVNELIKHCQKLTSEKSESECIDLTLLF